MLDKISSHVKSAVIAAESLYGQLLQKAGPAKEKALEITSGTIKKISHTRIELQKYAHEVTRSASHKWTELRKSIDVSDVLKQLTAKLNEIFKKVKTTVESATRSIVRNIQQRS